MPRRPKRPRPLWYLLLSNTRPILQLLFTALLAGLLYRFVVYMLTGIRVWW